LRRAGVRGACFSRRWFRDVGGEVVLSFRVELVVDLFTNKFWEITDGETSKDICQYENTLTFKDVLERDNA
jgi:hypothetical protein